MLLILILPNLVHLYNCVIKAKIFSAIWKNGLVTLIPIVSNPVNPKDFRPLSVVPAASILLDKILLDQIVGHGNNVEEGLFPENQSGYRKGYSTTTALAKITHDVYNNLDGNRCTIMVLVHLSLAFNCVKHQLLGRKLFSRNACDLIAASFLKNRTQAVMLRPTEHHRAHALAHCSLAYKQIF